MFNPCKACGELNDDQAIACRQCHAPLPRRSPSSTVVPASPSVASGGSSSARMPTSPLPAALPVPVQPTVSSQSLAHASTSLNAVSPRPSSSPAARTTGNQVSGVVQWADTARQEPRDRSFVQAITAPLSFLGCLSLPFLLLLAALAEGQILLVLLIAGGLWFIAKMFTSQNLMNFLYFKTIFFPSSGAKSNHLVPVQSFRLQTDSGGIASVRRKGESDSSQAGHIVEGDQVTFWGVWKGGTLHAHRAYNHKTNAWTAVQRPRPWVAILMLLIVALLLGSLISSASRVGKRGLPGMQPLNSRQN